MKTAAGAAATRGQAGDRRDDLYHRLAPEPLEYQRIVGTGCAVAVLRKIVKLAVPTRWRRSILFTLTRFSVWPPAGLVRLGSLRRVTPIAPLWPARPGGPVDRVYIERFLQREAVAIRGDVLEVGDLDYTTRFGAGVSSASILHSPIGAGPEVTYAADLQDAPELPSASFDCVVAPQTLLFIFDVQAAVRTLHRILRPGGIALVTVPGISPSVPEDKERWGQYWSFTEDSLQRLFRVVFGCANVEVRSHGNVLTTTAFLHGLGVADLRRRDFDVDDPSFPLILTVRAVRSDRDRACSPSTAGPLP